MRTVPRRIAAVILAGGRSSRMGQNKALISLGGKTLLQHVTTRLSAQVNDIVVNVADNFPALPDLPRVPDSLPGQLGPLAGVLAGLRYYQRRVERPDWLLSASCDSPFLPLDLAERLGTQAVEGAVITAASAGRLHPTFSLWPLDLADDLEAWLQADEKRRMTGFLARHRQVTVDFPLRTDTAGELDPFFNINEPADLLRAQAFSSCLDQ